MYIKDVGLKLKWEFKQRKFLPYKAKLNLTETRIRDFGNYFDTYVSFSGGLDSTVLLDMVRKTLGKDIPAVFVNTGLDIRMWMKTMSNSTRVRIEIHELTRFTR